MPPPSTLTISLPEDLAAWIEAQVAAGLQPDAAAVVRACLEKGRAAGSDASGLSESAAREIIASATDFAIVTTDRAGAITSWNPGAENILGWSAAEAIGRLASMFFTPEDVASGAPQTEMARALKEGRAVDERWHIRKSGVRFWASGLLMPLRQGEGGFVKIMRDRTVERDAERRYHAMTAALPGFVFVTDADGNNTETNDVFQQFTGRSAEELAGQRWIEVLHEDDRTRAAETWGHAVRTGQGYEATYRFRRHDGEYCAFACRGVPERDESGRILRWMGTCIDVENETRARIALERLTVMLEHRATEREGDLAAAIDDLRAEMAHRARIEEALRQSQKLEAVGQLTGGVAHDFNNLLTIIRSSVDLLRRPSTSEERRKRYLDAIADTADRAAGLTQQLLAFARRQPLTPRIFDAGERIANLASMLRAALGATITLDLDMACHPCAIEADPTQFDTALHNMVVNARDAISGEGRVTIRIEAADKVPARRSHAARAGDFIAVSIADTGQGIAPDKLAHIFEPFFTTKEIGKGTGLGLSQVFGFAKQSGGDITVQSRPGEGSVFTLYLPRASQPPENLDGGEDHPGELPAETREAQGCVLVVEDNATVGEFAAQLLDDLGYRTEWAPNAAAALEQVGRQPNRFDIVFTASVHYRAAEIR